MPSRAWSSSSSAFTEPISSGNGKLGCSFLDLSGSPFFSCGTCTRPSNLRTPPLSVPVSVTFPYHPVAKPPSFPSVAFCFYNLSSIVNGLIYFDQISLLSTTHLLLVILGIFILLGGVWAVSLQAVNIDTWSSGDEGDVPLIEDGAINEGSLPEYIATPAPPVPQSPERQHVRAHSESATSPPQSPLSPRRRPTHIHLGHSTIGGTAPISSPPSAVHAPVFSIGLSPASPGFVLVPRRSTSAQPGGDPWVETIRRVRSRRVVSDTNALAGEEVEQGIDQARSVENENMDSRGRWAWLRRLLVGQRSVS